MDDEVFLEEAFFVGAEVGEVEEDSLDETDLATIREEESLNNEEIS